MYRIKEAKWWVYRTWPSNIIIVSTGLYSNTNKNFQVQEYEVDSVQRGTCFILVDHQHNKFLLPSEFSVKFSVEIKPEEYNSSYFDNKGLFSLPEVITRYELPVEIEFSPGTESGSVPAQKLLQHPLKMTSVAIAKSIVGAVFDSKAKKFRYIELSPATQIKLAIPKYLLTQPRLSKLVEPALKICLFLLNLYIEN